MQRACLFLQPFCWPHLDDLSRSYSIECAPLSHTTSPDHVQIPPCCRDCLRRTPALAGVVAMEVAATEVVAATEAAVAATAAGVMWIVSVTMTAAAAPAGAAAAAGAVTDSVTSAAAKAAAAAGAAAGPRAAAAAGGSWLWVGAGVVREGLLQRWGHGWFGGSVGKCLRPAFCCRAPVAVQECWVTSAGWLQGACF